MKGTHVVSLAARSSGILACCFLFFASWRIAHADLLAVSTVPGSLEAAIRLDPENPEYRRRLAERDLYARDVDKEKVKQELRGWLLSNPLSAEALTNLGLLAEEEGRLKEAEHFFVDAVAIDHTYKPVWTLANLYFRTNQVEEMRAVLREALDISIKPNISYFDVPAVYDLFWATRTDPKQILAAVPNRGPALLSYFFYLVSHQHTDAAFALYPRALPYANASLQLHRDEFGAFCNLVFQGKQTDQAVTIWNELVEKQLIASTQIDTAKAKSIANPGFEFLNDPAPFGWFVAIPSSISRTWAPHSVRFEFDGSQPEQVLLLAKNIPVAAGASYSLAWDAEGSRITRPSDPRESGINLRFSIGGNTLPATCAPFTLPALDRKCTFTVPQTVSVIRLELLCERPAGSVKLRGALQLSGFHLAFDK